jgi:hypothetical protein
VAELSEAELLGAELSAKELQVTELNVKQKFHYIPLLHHIFFALAA